MSKQTISIPRGVAVTAEISLALAGVERFDFSGISLKLWCKRFPWQVRSESFFSLELGAALSVEATESLESAARIDLSFTSEETAAMPIGDHVWELWATSGEQEAPVSYGIVSVSFGPSLAGLDFSSLFEVSVAQDLPWLKQASITFADYDDLEAFLSAHKISIVAYDAILTALGYTIPTADVALASGELTGELIYETFKNL